MSLPIILEDTAKYSTMPIQHTKKVLQEMISIKCTYYCGKAVFTLQYSHAQNCGSISGSTVTKIDYICKVNPLCGKDRRRTRPYDCVRLHHIFSSAMCSSLLYNQIYQSSFRAFLKTDLTSSTLPPWGCQKMTRSPL